MRLLTMPAAAWCLAVFVVWDLVVAFFIAFYVICPCCWPFPQCTIQVPTCRVPPCIRKCCPKDHELYKSNHLVSAGCTPKNHSLAESSWANGTDVNHTVYDEYNDHIGSYGLCPHGMYGLYPSSNPSDVHTILPDGRLFINNSKDIFLHDQFCQDAFHGKPITVFVCFKENAVGEMTEGQRKWYPLTLSVSVPFLLLTVFVYLLLPELQNLHGKCLVCYLVGLTVAYVSLVQVQYNTFNMNADHPTFCKVTAFVIQFSFLATFFWLNIMCFDIWWVFSGLRPLQGTVKEREQKKFIFYSLYAWGGPLIIFIISLVMELVPSIPDTFIKPEFGVDKCWFKDNKALVLYFYLPIGVLVFLNIVMFVTTAFRLCAHTRETQVLQSSESRRNDEAERQRFNLYLKLFIVMGINWVMELASFVIGGPKSIWFVTDIGNTLQGLLIFLIFVWKRRILRLLNQKLCPRWELVATTSTSIRSKTEKQETAKTNSK